MTRPRTKRREHERALRKGVRRIAALTKDLPGGAPNNAIDVASASIIESKARATACLQCEGTLELHQDRATSTPHGLLRELTLRCQRCHAPRTLWFRIVSPAN
jgi:hypothetical protein